MYLAHYRASRWIVVASFAILCLMQPWPSCGSGLTHRLVKAISIGSWIEGLKSFLTVVNR